MDNWWTEIYIKAIMLFIIGLIILLCIIIAMISDMMKLHKLKKNDREKIKGGR